MLAASYEAKAFGVGSAMGGAKARRLCPHAAVVPPRMSAYSEASKAVFAVFEDMAPVVEGISIDEAFLDVRGMEHFAGTPREIAARLRERVRDEVGLPITVGVASTKHLAKVASASAKPDGLLVVPAGEELAFLHPLPVERLWGVGPATAGKLHARGLTTVGQVAALPEGTLVAIVGRAAGRHLHALAHNRDPRPVQGRTRRRSIGSQRALGRGNRSAAELDAILVGLVDRVTLRLRTAKRACRTVVLRLRFADYARATRSQTLPEATTAHRRDPGGAARAAGGGRAADPRARDHAAGDLAHEPVRGGRRPARAAAGPAPVLRAGLGRRRRARPLRERGDHARGAARPRPGGVDAAAARLVSCESEIRVLRGGCRVPAGADRRRRLPTNF